MSIARRRALLWAALAPWAARHSAAPAGEATHPTLVFPRDHGSHPLSRIEWWYVTGHARSGTSAQPDDVGFQITFFRSRPDGTQTMNSRFAARQIVFAHAAITDLRSRRFWHDQRVARAGFGIAEASETDTGVRLRDWSLVHRDGVYQAMIRAQDFSLDVAFTATQPVLLQGDNGVSRKGPDANQTSFYYSRPQLAFEGTIGVQGKTRRILGAGGNSANDGFVPGSGAAWLDHEWSGQFMHPLAVGWDWVGINLFDGSALTAFRLRDKHGAALWDGGSFRHRGNASGQRVHVFRRGETLFQALRTWRSALTQASYPVEWQLQTPTDNYMVRALLDNQELDSRNSTGAVYWEGLCDLFGSDKRHVGRGYLEMTGVAKPLVL